ncbi:MAG: hypothetical protein F4Z19_06685, partial [Holophagales bacterium]|nr:hypothetical protein [Holophagales bacterium]
VRVQVEAHRELAPAPAPPSPPAARPARSPPRPRSAPGASPAPAPADASTDRRPGGRTRSGAVPPCAGAPAPRGPEPCHAGVRRGDEWRTASTRRI